MLVFLLKILVSNTKWKNYLNSLNDYQKLEFSGKNNLIFIRFFKRKRNPVKSRLENSKLNSRLQTDVC